MLVDFVAGDESTTKRMNQNIKHRFCLLIFWQVRNQSANPMNQNIKQELIICVDFPAGEESTTKNSGLAVFCEFLSGE